MKAKKFIRTEKLGNGLVQLEMTNAGRRNAMNEVMASEFFDVVRQLKKNAALRVLILTGAGEVFSAGGDLEMLEGKITLPRQKNRQLMKDFYKKFLSITELDVPVVAAINGHAMGAALCLALACDLRCCVRSAKLGLNFVHLGLHPGMGATYFLPRLVGVARTNELLFSGKVMTANEAHELGIVNQVFDDDKFSKAVLNLAEQLTAASPQATRELKQTLRGVAGRTLNDALMCEATAQAKDYAGADFKEGITAAREKRKPEFS